ncbi:hypothetical protein QJQ45_006056 [Haematococcus lacustris]|nr:hypothetical protein QJQ45_006056 [Haematococcus lacustris]
MKALVDGKRREVSYHPGAQVLLSTVNMRNNQNEQGVRKLKPRYVGPFTVLRMIGKVAVQLHLPPSWNRMHNVFHVSLVKPYCGNQTPNLAAPPPVQWLEGEPVYEVEKLLAHRVVKLKGRNRGKGRPKSREWLLGPWAHLQLDPQVWGMGTTTLLDFSVKLARVRLHQLQRVSADPLYRPSGGRWPALWGVRPPRAAGEPDVAAVADGALRELELMWEASAQQVAG